MPRSGDRVENAANARLRGPWRMCEVCRAALQWWHPKGCTATEAADVAADGLICRCGSRWGCADAGAAKEAAPRLWQPRGCTAEEAAEGAVLQVWKQRCSRLATLQVWQLGLHCTGGSLGSVLQVWQPMGLRCRRGSQWGCAAGVAAQGAALQVWQPRGLRCRCGSPRGCAASVAAQGAALQVWQPRGLRCKCGSPGGCAASVAAQGAALQVWQPKGAALQV